MSRQRERDYARRGIHVLPGGQPVQGGGPVDIARAAPVIARAPHVDPLARLPPPLSSWIARRLMAEPGPKVILECGANVGQDTTWLAAIPGATVHAFEADPRNRPAGPIPGSVRWTHAAVCDRDGRAMLRPSKAVDGKRWTESSSICKPTGHLTKHPWVAFGAPVEVPAVTLDSYARAHGIDRVDFVWADVQGAERKMIEGGRQTLASAEWLYTEYSDVELYEGQPTLSEILSMLGPSWHVIELVEDGSGNALLHNASAPAARPPVVTALTSLAPDPASRELQRACVNSWIDAGCAVVALQPAAELQRFATREWSGVRFVEVEASAHLGRPLPTIHAMIEWARRNVDGYAMLINSDCYLLASTEKLRGICNATGEGLCYLVRHDVDGGRATRIHGGVDGFLFHAARCPALAPSRLLIGKPGWDYWLPLAYLAAGRALHSPSFATLLHRKHALRWNDADWHVCVAELGRALGRPVPAEGRAMHQAANDMFARFTGATRTLALDPSWPVDTPAAHWQPVQVTG
jgi:FkbM family methyltransferase